MRIPQATLRSTLSVLLIDVIILAGYLYLIPQVVRPFEVLMAVLVVLSIATALFSQPKWLQAGAVMLTSIALTVFALELAEKFFHITTRLVPVTVGANTIGVTAVGGSYDWQRNVVAEYLAVRDRAVADGLNPEALAQDFAGQVFAQDNGVWHKDSHSDGKRLVMQGYKNRYVYGSPLGYEYTADNLLHHWCREDGGRMLFDAKATINSAGVRETRGNPAGKEAWLFLGCSFTFGYGLSDHETLPQSFSQAQAYVSRVVNMGVSGYGPHQSLRDLELGRHVDRVGIVPSQVRGVVFSLIDDHTDRVERPNVPGAPVYGLDAAGELIFTGSVPDSWLRSRLYLLLERSRIYPALVWRLRNRGAKAEASYGARLTVAILQQMDKICRERYGVGLTIVYWNQDPYFITRFADLGIRVISVDTAFEAEWRQKPVLYELFDGHPSAYANRVLGEYLAATLANTATYGN